MKLNYKILDKIDWNALNKYIDNQLIVANKHPEYNLWILNYSPKVHFNRLWDEYTLAARGLVIDEDGNIIARPFQKFMNLEEFEPGDIDMSQEYEIFEKIDGSLIILFYYELRMEWVIASRGSFISEQVMEAKKLFNYSVVDNLNTQYTYLFEIIYPENRIVIDYGDARKLILLSKIKTATGEECSYDYLLKKFSNYFEIVKKIDVKVNDLYELKKLEEENKEGFVVRFKNNFRVKVKFKEYVRLHGILTNVSNITIWEYLKNNYNFDLLYDKIPDEYYSWIKKTAESMQNDFFEIERNALKEFVKIYHINDIKERKEFALNAIKTKYCSILFLIYDKKSYNEVIWNMVKPKYSKPFRDGFSL